MTFYNKFLFVLLLISSTNFAYVELPISNTITGTDINYYTGEIYITSIPSENTLLESSIGKISPTSPTFAPRGGLQGSPTKCPKVLYGQQYATFACAFASNSESKYNQLYIEGFTTDGTPVFRQETEDVGTTLQGAAELGAAPANVSIAAVTGGRTANYHRLMVGAYDATADPVTKFCIVNYQIDWDNFDGMGGEGYAVRKGNIIGIVPTTFVGGMGNPVGSFSDDLIMHYEPELKKLYISNKTLTLTLNDGGVYPFCNILIYALDAVAGGLSQVDPYTQATATDANGWANSAPYNIIGIRASGNSSTHTLSMHNLTTVKIQGDKFYLIVHGGVGTLEETYDKIYSLPLVSNTGSNDAGKLTKKESEGAPYFENVASTSSELYTTADAPRVGGNGAPPWSSAATVKLRAAQNTVYAIVSDDSTADAKEASGIYYSQATVDDETGAITTWTNWARAVPITRGPAEDDGRISHGEINIRNCKVWAVPTTDDGSNSLTFSSWTKTLTPSSIRSSRRPHTRALEDIVNHGTAQFKSNTVIHKISFYVLNDNFESVPFYIYAGTLTSGKEGIVIMRQTEDDIAVNDHNFRIIELPENSPKILSVGYSNWQAANDFPVGALAVGTQNGCYALLEEDEDTYIGGFPASGDDSTANMYDLDEGYWANAQFYKVFEESMTGNIVTITSHGNGIYFLNRGTDPSTIKDTVYRIVPNDLANGIENTTPSIVLASSEHGAPDAIHLIDIITSDQDGTAEQLIVGTVTGAYTTQVTGGIQNADHENVQTSILPSTRNEIVQAFTHEDDGSVNIVTRKPFTPPHTRHQTNVSFVFDNDAQPTPTAAAPTAITSQEATQINSTIIQLPSEYSENQIPPQDPFYDDPRLKGVDEIYEFTDGARYIKSTNIAEADSVDGERCRTTGLLAGSSLPHSLTIDSEVSISTVESVFDGLTVISNPTIVDGTLTITTVYHTLTLD